MGQQGGGDVLRHRLELSKISVALGQTGGSQWKIPPRDLLNPITGRSRRLERTQSYIDGDHENIRPRGKRTEPCLRRPMHELPFLKGTRRRGEDAELAWSKGSARRLKSEFPTVAECPQRTWGGTRSKTSGYGIRRVVVTKIC